MAEADDECVEPDLTRSVVEQAIREARLREGESIVRIDMVHAVAASPWYAIFDFSYGLRLACMVITSDRVLFIPPLTGWRYNLLVSWRSLRNDLLWKTRSRHLGPKPRLSKRVEVELRDVERLWKWQPEFSGAVRLQLSVTRRFEFYLAQQTHPWLPLEGSIDEKRAHFESLEAAWRSVHDRRAAS
jgi:hypothetical protein